MKFQSISVLILLLGSCATKGPSAPRRPSEPGPTQPATRPSVPNSGEVPSETEESAPEAKLEPVSVGVWIDGAGVESFTALGFLQGLEKSEKVAINKVVGTGLGCWIALSWSMEKSTHRAEWQAMKLSGWDSLGRGSNLLARLAGAKAEFSKFKAEISRLLPLTEFRALSQESDCPVLDARTGRLESSRNMGIYKSLWTQMMTPIGGFKGDDLNASRSLSGVLALRPKARELDEFSTISMGRKEVQAWIVLSLNGANVLSEEPDVLRDTLSNRFVDSTHGGSMTPENRPVMTMIPTLDLTVKNSRDFAQRRAFLLQGRKLAERFLAQPWLDRIHQGQGSLEVQSPQ